MGVQEAWTENEPGEDRSDVGWTPERGVEHQVGWQGDQASGWLCVYLGGMVTEDGHSEVEVRHWIQAGANVWRKVEAVMLDTLIFKS